MSLESPLPTLISIEIYFGEPFKMDFTLEPGVEFNFQPLNVNAGNGIAKLDFSFPFFEDYMKFWQRQKETSFLGRWHQRFDQ